MGDRIYGAVVDGVIERFDDWDTYNKATEGKHRIIKRFNTEEQRDQWEKLQLRWRVSWNQPSLVAFVDGSIREGKAAWGVAIYERVKSRYYCIHAGWDIISHSWNVHRNETGELTAAVRAAQWAHDNNTSLVIVHDYEGIVAYPTETWRPLSEMTQKYVQVINKHSDNIVGFHWVKGHQKGGFLAEGNDHADMLAAKAYGI